MIRNFQDRFPKRMFDSEFAPKAKTAVTKRGSSEPCGMLGTTLGIMLSAVAGLMLLASVSTAPAWSQDKPGSQGRGKASTSSDSSASGDVTHGKSMFMRDGCYHCHGFGAAGTGSAPALLANPIPLEAFIAYVRHPSRSMPPFTEKVISDKDLTDIFAFIHSLPKPQDAKSIPMLNE